MVAFLATVLRALGQQKAIYFAFQSVACTQSPMRAIARTTLTCI